MEVQRWRSTGKGGYNGGAKGTAASPRYRAMGHRRMAAHPYDCIFRESVEVSECTQQQVKVRAWARPGLPEEGGGQRPETPEMWASVGGW